MRKLVKIKIIFVGVYLFTIYLMANSFADQSYCLNNNFLEVPNNSINCYIRVSKKTLDEVTILNEFSDREKKYFDSQEYKELLSSKGKELQRIKDPSLNLEKKKEINQADDFNKRRKQECERRNRESIDSNSTARSVCMFQEKDKSICWKKFPPNYKPREYTSQKEFCY